MDLSVVKQDLGPYRQLDRQRDGFQRAFDQFLAAEPGLRGDVLDIGAGAGPSPFPTNLPRRIDGVDPSDAVLKHPSLTRRWYGAFETADIPPASYDLALAYNVAEHIEHARPFFEKVRSVLRPGGVFWALTPHGRHPFCKIARAVELLGGKRAIARRAVNVNAYSSYYRLNTAPQVLRAIDGLGFASAKFVYMPSMHWDSYFPRALRWAPHLFDYVLGTRAAPFMLILAYRLQVPQ